MPILRIMAALFFTALTACLFLAIHLAGGSSTSSFWRELNNFGHVPLFGIIALSMFATFLNLPGIRARRRTTIYLLTLAAVLLLAAVSEWMQVYGPRDADLGDFVRDLAGAVCALSILATFDGKLLEQEPWKRQRFRRMVRAAAATLLLVAFIPVAMWMESYRRRSARMPMLMRFDSRWELRFIEHNGAELQLAPPPGEWEQIARDRVGKVTFAAGRFPGLVFREPYPDWTPYTYFSLDLYSELDRPMDIVLRIDDAHSNKWVEDRFNLRMTLQPGANLIRFPLEEMRTAPKTRKMDLSAVSMMVLFAVRPEEPCTLYLADMKLE
jgi:VanZ family protein